MTCEFCDRMIAAVHLVRAAEKGLVTPVEAVTGAFLLVWQALEWNYGARP